MVDSAESDFPAESFGCTSINNRGAIAFKAGRTSPNGIDFTPGIYRANPNGSVTTIAQNQRRFEFIGFNPSMNNQGQVSFSAALDREDPQTGQNFESIFRGDGGRLTVIASTTDEFESLKPDTSVSGDGEVAFRAERDEEFGFDEGLFSGRGTNAGVTTHYLNSADVILDGSPARFDGGTTRPAINNLGEIGVRESPGTGNGVFRGQEGNFTTIDDPFPTANVSSAPTLNNSGTAAFERVFFDPDPNTGELPEDVVKGSGGALTTVADNSGGYGSFFGFRPPSINNSGEVAFQALLDDLSTTGIFVGPDPVADKVIATGDTLDGDTVQYLSFCEEGLNGSGQLAFRADFVDPATSETRTAIFRATPAP